jgi:glyoxylase-like metal-dependent hydrolase (beta-lactamase superfamily II)
VFAAPAGDTELMYHGTDNKWFANGSSRSVCPEASLLVGEDDIIRLGETEIRIIGTPGHTSGGITFYADNIAFTGDTLFRLSVGVTNYKTGNRKTMVRTIQNRLYALPDDTIVYPGHGPATTIGFEKKNNPFVKSCVAD